ncbi:MAG TPA: serine/threonine-protein phosphatase, partial [Candidatus Omnitrophica bacterium]|nr:serine/threonine-protein phosphatase [Candidatus Omnitrophota bacterium]
IASFMKPAREVGGDLYQFISTSKDKLSIMIADVSGKGIPAALFMVRVVTEFKIRAGKYSSPKKVLSEVNNQLLKESKTGLFVTVSYCLVDIKSMEVFLSDAGHLPVLFYDAKSNEVKEIRPEKGMPIGLLPNIEFNDELINLSKGDVLLFYTDGVTEARDTKAQEFGLDRLKDTLKTYHHQTAPLILDGIKSELKNFSKKAPQHDDITLIVLKVV